MKKTLTVNLGGTVFHIDEDAYQLLDKYLSNLRIHFRKEEGSDEIMDDFEMRISELLNERVRLGYEVITIEQVEEVIKRMGKPEEIFEEEEKSTDHEDNYRAQQQETHTQTTKKRLMRDPDNRILGGVAGGFAAYMDWDPTAVTYRAFPSDVLLWNHGSALLFVVDHRTDGTYGDRETRDARTKRDGGEYRKDRDRWIRESQQ